jgi:hypothetical protein
VPSLVIGLRSDRTVRTSRSTLRVDGVGLHTGRIEGHPERAVLTPRVHRHGGGSAGWPGVRFPRAATPRLAAGVRGRRLHGAGDACTAHRSGASAAHRPLPEGSRPSRRPCV